jgi:hypothetical protein
MANIGNIRNTAALSSEVWLLVCNLDAWNSCLVGCYLVDGSVDRQRVPKQCMLGLPSCYASTIGGNGGCWDETGCKEWG